MPAGKFRSISISEECYNRLKEIADARDISISKAIEQIVFEKQAKSITTTINEDVIEKIVSERISEVVSKAFKDLESMLYNIVKKVILELSTKKKFIETIKEAFLGKREPITLKKAPIEIRKGEIVFKTTEKPEMDLSQFKAKLVENTNDEGMVIGYSIVPDIGFEDMSLEEWFDNYGSELLKVFQV